MRTLIFITSIALLLIQNISAQNFWQQTNGPYGGTVLTINTTSNNILLSGTSNGVFCSEDLGQNWYMCFENLKYKTISSLEMFNNDFFLILDYDALVRNSNSQLDTLYFNIEDRPNVITIKNDGKIFLGTDFNIYLSSDQGKNWVSIEDSMLQVNFSKNIIIKNDSIIFYAAGNDISRSLDDGQTWTLLNQSFRNAPISTLHLDTDGYLYAATDNNKIFKSTDDGNTWENIDNNYFYVQMTSLTKESNNIYLGTNQGIYKTTNNGITWLPFSNGLINKYISYLKIVEGKVIAGTFGGGLYILNSSNDQWESKVNGLDANRIIDFTFDSENNVLTATDGFGIHRALKNDPSNWEMIVTGLVDPTISSLAISKNPNTYDHIYTSTYFGTNKTTNLGTIWTNLNSPCYSGIYSICVNDSGYVFIYSYCGVFRTTNDGVSWDLMNSNNWGGYIYCLASSPNQNNVYLSSELFFYRTTNNGNTWTQLGMSGGRAFRIKINSEGHIYLLNFFGQIFRSTNSGSSFQSINNGLPAEYDFMRDLAFNSADHIYLATRDGLYFSNNEGSSWQLIDESLTSKFIYVLDFNNEDRLYAGLISGGVYRSSELLTDVKEIKSTVENFTLSQNYP
ncbi:MAG TPA: hypothetical protein VLH59_08705, partial [Ignavibacteriaceae bacterium]|nr:hypothetical protein [Ignavibacteriaceae bacterium]